MPRRMSVSLTVDAVRDRRKTVTRRHVSTWRDLQPGARLTLIEKGMGLPKGAKQVVVAEVEIVSVRVEPILAVTASEIAAEGFDPNEWGDLAWAAWWAIGHGHRLSRWGPDQSYPEWQRYARAALADVQCRRIEWRYLGDQHGCIECDFTGLHAPPPDRIGDEVIEVERHDECATFDDDFEAAAFVALCHPQYDRLTYRTDDGRWVMLDPARVTDEAYLAAAPPIGEGEPVVLCTAELLTDEGTPR